MHYMGGKSRLAVPLRWEMLARAPGCRRYIEPFIGGGSVFVEVAPYFPGRCLGADAHPDLARLWADLLRGWQPPKRLGLREYAAARRLPSPSALKAFVGFGCSFGGKWFAGFAHSKGRDYVATARGTLLTKAAILRGAGARVICADYRDLRPGPGDLVYCDPPYAGTESYGGMPPFDHGEFWSIMELWAWKGAQVFVSEQACPVPHQVVWSAGFKRGLDSARSVAQAAEERLFLVGATAAHAEVGT